LRTGVMMPKRSLNYAPIALEMFKLRLNWPGPTIDQHHPMTTPTASPMKGIFVFNRLLHAMIESFQRDQYVV
jgi:hypothetical protein